MAETAAPGPLRSAVLEITNRCNLRCPHCASSSGLARAGEMTGEEISALLRDIRSLGGQEITLIGGEALLRGDWTDIARTVHALGMRLVLISNGLLFTQDTFAELRQLRPHLIGISVDGATPQSYRALRGRDGLATCLRVLRQLLADGHTHVNAITTFSRRNLLEFDALADLFAGTGITWQVQIANHGGDRWDHGQFLSRSEFGWLAARMREVYVHRRGQVRLRHMDDFGYFPLDPKLRFLHQTWQGCIAGRELIGVRSNGDVMGCLSLGDEFVEANLRTVPLRELWQSGRYFRQLRHKEELLHGECAACPWALECRAGCSAIAWSATGSLGCNSHCLRSLETEAILKQAAPDELG
ncbi:MAG: radical SAM protein [Polyangiaceae bacterium]|nr:radical SAM protein [Polyangiaceae bacterium]